MNIQRILQLGSVTPGAVPSASQLVTNASGVELAINAADGRLFYKDTAGNVRVLADVTATDRANANITSGFIDGAPIGDTTPERGAFTSLKTTTLTVSSITGLLKSAANSGVTAALPGVDFLAPSARGAANGVASLDANQRIYPSQLPSFVAGGLYYAGFWDADSNTPSLASSVGTNGVFYKVSVAGATTLDGVNSWSVGDTVIFNALRWERLTESSAPVSSVNGLTGAVVIDPASIGAATSGVNSNITRLTGLTTALSVVQGGTGGVGFNGLVKASGSSPFAAAVAGADYAVPPSGGNAQLLANDGGGGFSNVTIGAGLTYSSGVLTATAASTGTVTSVQASGGTTGLTFTGGPITNQGTVTLGGTLSIISGGTGANSRQAAINGLVAASVSGTYLRSNGNDAIMSSIQVSDVPTLNQNTTGSAARVTDASQPAITSVGILTSLDVLGETDIEGPLKSAGNPGNAGQVLTSAGFAGPPVWTTPVQIDTLGTVTSVNVSGGTTGVTFGGGPITGAGTITMGGVLAVTNGGTGVTTATGSGSIVKENAPIITGATLLNGELNNVIIGAATPSSGAFTSVNAVSVTALSATVGGALTLTGSGARLIVGTAGVAGQVLTSGGPSAAPRWTSAGTVTSVSATGGMTGLTFTGGPITGEGTLIMGGVLAPSSGGTGSTTVTGTGANVLSDSPSLTTPDLGTPSSANLVNAFGLPIANTTGVLPINRGGTGATTLSGMLKGDGAGIVSASAGTDYAAPPIGTPDQLLANNGTGGFSNVTIGAGLTFANNVLSSTGTGVTSVNIAGGTTGLTFAGGPITSNGVFVMGGMLAVTNGGTGTASLTGLLKGNGTDPVTGAIAGTDYAPATTASRAQLLAGNATGGFSNVTVGTGLFLSNGILTATFGGSTPDIVTSVDVSGGITGLTFTGGPITSAGVVTMDGVLSVTNGGTGSSSLVGLLKGNGTSVGSAVPGLDFAPPTSGTAGQLQANNGTGGFANVTLGNNLSLVSGVLDSISEWVTIVGKPPVIASGLTKVAALASIDAASVTDPRFTDPRTPIGAAGGVLSGTYPNPGFAVPMATTAEVAAAVSPKVDKIVGKGLSTEDFTTADKVKLAGIAPGATANASNAELRARASHTGQQSIDTISGLRAELENLRADIVAIKAFLNLP